MTLFLNYRNAPNYYAAFMILRNRSLVKLDEKENLKVLIDYIVDTMGGVVSEEYADPYGQGRIKIRE